MNNSHTTSLFRVEFLETGRTVIVEPGSTIMDAAQKAGVYLNSICGGEGLCGKCRVIVEKGRVSMKPNSLLEDSEIEKGYVLACLSEVLSDVLIKIPEESRIDEKPKFDGKQAEGLNPDREGSLRYPLNPLCRKKYLELPEPSLSDNMSDLDRIKRGLMRTTGIQVTGANLDSIRALPDVLRESGFTITVTYALRDGVYEVVQFENGDTSGTNYGIAVDLGTTTVMANLVDLTTGNICASTATYNSQIRYGEDVITRIVYAQENRDGLEELHQSAVHDINILTERLVGETGIHPDDVTCMVCTGNTVMIHFLLGINPRNIRREPYIPVIGDPPTLYADEIGLAINKRGYLGLLPGFGAYVGSDITADLLASGMVHAEKTCLLIDVGTNGEIVLGCKDWFICCSASAGPAFEGAGTSCGTRATSGAIEKVRLHKDGSVDLGIVGGSGFKPVGICGSGYIDLVAELFTAGFVDRTGRFRTDTGNSRIRKGVDGPEFLLVEKECSATGKDIIITENDIITLIRTKGAIFTAAEVILNHVGLSWTDIDTIYISGGFGNYLDIDRSIIIGLLPDLDHEKFHFIGNGSIAGARMCLLSEDMLMTAKRVAHAMTYFDLSTDPLFMKEYTSSLFLPHTDLNKFPTVEVL
jgi:uncharacterized 2Fe-2S/4Fe-4S cluster protein (DUF4445 family)